MSPKSYNEFPEKEKCGFCQTSDPDRLLGTIYGISDLFVHYLCLLLSSQIVQKGKDNEGILGFLTPDIKKEIKRGATIKCTYCGKNGATIQCNYKKCNVSFHFPCGLENGTFHYFFGSFESYCAKHRPKQKLPEMHKKLENVYCIICSAYINTSLEECILPKCCTPSTLLHKKCIQKLVSFQGYDTQCPLCKNDDIYCDGLKKCGIYIPDMDLTFELEREETLESVSYNKECTYPECLCPKGNKFEIKRKDSKWFINSCHTCGTNGMHKLCLEKFEQKLKEEKENEEKKRKEEGNSDGSESRSQSEPVQTPQTPDRSQSEPVQTPQTPDENKNKENADDEKKYNCIFCLEFNKNFKERQNKNGNQQNNQETTEEDALAQKSVRPIRPPRFPRRVPQGASTSTSEEVVNIRTSEEVVNSRTSEEVVNSRTSEEVDNSRTSEEVIEILSSDSELECFVPGSFPRPIQRRRRKRKAASGVPHINRVCSVQNLDERTFRENFPDSREEYVESYLGPSTSQGIRRSKMPIPHISQEVIDISDSDSSDDIDINIPGSGAAFNCPEYSFILDQLSSKAVEYQHVKKKRGRPKGKKSTYSKRKKKTINKITLLNLEETSKETVSHKSDPQEVKSTEVNNANTNSSVIFKASLFNNLNAIENYGCLAYTDKMKPITANVVDSSVTSEAFSNNFKVNENTSSLANIEKTETNNVNVVNSSVISEVSLLNNHKGIEKNSSLTNTDKSKTNTVNVLSSSDCLAITDKTEANDVNVVNSSVIPEVSLLNNDKGIGRNGSLANTDKTEASIVNFLSTSDCFAITDKTEANANNIVNTSVSLANTDKAEANTVNVFNTSDCLAITNKTEANNVNIVNSSAIPEVSLLNNDKGIGRNGSLANTDKTEANIVNFLSTSDCFAITDKTEANTVSSSDSLVHTDKTEANADNIVNTSVSLANIDKAEANTVNVFNTSDCLAITNKTEANNVNSSVIPEVSLLNNDKGIGRNGSLANTDKTEANIVNFLSTSDCFAITDKTEANTVSSSDSLVHTDKTEANADNIVNTSVSLANIDKAEANTVNVFNTSDCLAITNKTEANNVNIVNSSVIPEVSLLNNDKGIGRNGSLANTDKTEANIVNFLNTSDCFAITDKTEANTVSSSDSLVYTDKTEANADNIVNTSVSLANIDKAVANTVNVFNTSDCLAITNKTEVNNVNVVNSSVIPEVSLLNNDKGIGRNGSLVNTDKTEANIVNTSVSLANIDKAEANTVNVLNRSLMLANIDKTEANNVNVVNLSVISEVSLRNNYKGIERNSSLANIDETEANTVNIVSSSDNLASTVNINRSQDINDPSVDINETKFVEHSTETCIIGNTCLKQQGGELTVTEKKSIDYSKEIFFKNSPYKNVDNSTTCDKTWKKCLQFTSDALLEQKNSNKRKCQISRSSICSKRRKLSTIQLESNNKEIQSKSWINKSIPVDISPKVSLLNNALLSIDDNKGAPFDHSLDLLDQSSCNLSSCQKHVSDETLSCSFLSAERHNADILDKSSVVKSNISVETVSHESFSNLEEIRVKKSGDSDENLFKDCQTETGNLLSTFNKLDSLPSSIPEIPNPDEASEYENETINCTPVDKDLCKGNFPWYICCSTPCSSCANSKSHLENSFQSNSEESEILNKDAQFNLSSLAEIKNKSNILSSDNDLQQGMNSSETSSKDENQQKSADSDDSTLNVLPQPFCLPENTLPSSVEYSQNNPENYTNKTDITTAVEEVPFNESHSGHVNDIELNKRKLPTSSFNNYPEHSKRLCLGMVKHRESVCSREVVVGIPKGSNLVNLDYSENISCISSSEITSTKNDDSYNTETYKTATPLNLDDKLNNECSMVSSTVHLDSSPIIKEVYEKTTDQVDGNKKFPMNPWHHRRQIPPDRPFPGLIRVYVHYQNCNALSNSYTNRNHARNRSKTPLLPCVEILNPDKRELLESYIRKTFLYKRGNNVIIYTDSQGFRHGQLFIQSIPHYIQRRVVFESGSDLESYLQLILKNVTELQELNKPYMILIVCASPTNVPRTENVFNLMRSVTQIKNISLTVTTLLHSNNVEVSNFNKKLCDLSKLYYYKVWDINKILFKYPGQVS